MTKKCWNISTALFLNRKFIDIERILLRYFINSAEFIITLLFLFIDGSALSVKTYLIRRMCENKIVKTCLQLILKLKGMAKLHPKWFLKQLLGIFKVDDCITLAKPTESQSTKHGNQKYWWPWLLHLKGGNLPLHDFKWPKLPAA